MPRDPHVPLRVPPPMLEAVEREGRRTGQSRSAIIRELIVAELSRRGAWPPDGSTAERSRVAP